MSLKIPKWLKITIQVIAFIGFVILFDNLALIGIGLFFLIYSLIRAWQFRENIKLAMKTIESMIWGKPLDKDIWDKGEMRNTKVKIVWGKDKDVNK